MAMSDSDLRLARALLDGFVERNARGRLRTDYLKRASPEELNARRAMARLLRGDQPLDRQLRESLAGLFDPAPPEWEPREIKLESRRPGRFIDHAAATQVAEYVWTEVSKGERVEDAVADAADHYARSGEAVMKIWGRYRQIFERIYGPLPRKPRRKV